MEPCPSSGNPCPHPKNIEIHYLNQDGTESQSHCCQICPCAKQFGDGLLKTVLEIYGLFAGVSNAPVFDMPPCPGCGCTGADLNTMKRLGCPTCYQHFKQQLIPVLLHVHKDTVHRGKRPSERPKVLTLEEMLALAVKEERYEDAALIRDDIKMLANKKS